MVFALNNKLQLICFAPPFVGSGLEVILNSIFFFASSLVRRNVAELRLFFHTVHSLLDFLLA